MIGGSDCAELGALAYGRQGNNVTTKALIKVRTSNSEEIATARMRNVLAYKVVVICLGVLLLITVGGLLAQHYLGRNRESQRLLSSSVRAFSWKELYQATNGFEKLLGKGSFGEVYKGTIRSPQPHPHLIAVKKLIDSNEYSEQEFTNEVQSIGQIHHRNLVRMIGYCKEGKHRMLVFEFMPGGSLRSVLFNPDPLRPPLPSPGGLSTFTMAAAHRSSIVTSSPTTSCWMTVESRGSPTSGSPSCWGASRCTQQ
ncbi:G-type lectin S-receptor-like serine/threonine-protein kinase RLK1 [Hordeum vulgare]|nr:G-type lectin S-receptor-like serine/threonine-protein kinase RLK1 [Hordeum vulgare]